MQYEETVGIPNFLTLPFSSLGISTLRTGLGLYFPSRIFRIISLWFSFRQGRSPSHGVCNHHGTMTSADFSWQILFQPLPQMFYCIGRVHETSPGTHTLFPSYARSITTKYSSVQLLDFDLLCNLILVFSLKCSKPEFCLILSSDSTSRWTPLASAVSFPLPGGLGTFTR